MDKKFYYCKVYIYCYHFYNIFFKFSNLTLAYIYIQFDTFFYGSIGGRVCFGVFFIFVFLFVGSTVYGLISQISRGKKYGDIRVAEDSFFYWDGLFEHEFKWENVSKIRTTGAENRILKIFFKWNTQNHLLSPSSNNFIENYYRKKLVAKNVSIDLRYFRDKDSLVEEMKIPVKISSPEF